MEGRTVVVIAHRLSTVRNADLIVVVDERSGRRSGVGTPSCWPPAACTPSSTAPSSPARRAGVEPAEQSPSSAAGGWLTGPGPRYAPSRPRSPPEARPPRGPLANLGGRELEGVGPHQHRQRGRRALQSWRSRISTRSTSSRTPDMAEVSRSCFSGSTSSRPSGDRSSTRWSGRGVTVIRRPPGARTRANSAGLRGAKTLSDDVDHGVATGSGRQTSATTAPNRGWARAARRHAATETSRASARRSRSAVEQAAPSSSRCRHRSPRPSSRAPAGGDQRVGEGRVVPGGQEVGPGGDHRGGVGVGSAGGPPLRLR